jgi:hypothetical protein
LVDNGGYSPARSATAARSKNFCIGIDEFAASANRFISTDNQFVNIIGQFTNNSGKFHRVGNL